MKAKATVVNWPIWLHSFILEDESVRWKTKVHRHRGVVEIALRCFLSHVLKLFFSLLSLFLLVLIFNTSKMLTHYGDLTVINWILSLFVWYRVCFIHLFYFFYLTCQRWKTFLVQSFYSLDILILFFYLFLLNWTIFLTTYFIEPHYWPSMLFVKHETSKRWPGLDLPNTAVVLYETIETIPYTLNTSQDSRYFLK